MARRAASSSSATLGPQTRVCVLHGPEDMLKRQHVQALREAIDAAGGPVETITFDGKSAPLADVLDELRSFGLMQQHKLVIVDDAHEWVKQHREAVERYTQSPSDHGTLVLRAPEWHAGKLDKLIEKVGAIIKCVPPSDAEAVAWISRRCKEVHARMLSPKAAELLVDRLGADLGRLDSEAAKLALMVKPEEPIEPALVMQLVRRGSDEAAWAVQSVLMASMDKLGSRRVTGAGAALAAGPVIEKIHEIVDLSGQSEVVVVYAVADLMRKLMLASSLRKQGAGDAQIASELRLWGDQKTAMMGLLRRLDEATAARLFDRVMELDRRSRTGLGDPVRNLECFCAELADFFN
jgi:DNA polymerase III subunit delta